MVLVAGFKQVQGARACQQMAVPTNARAREAGPAAGRGRPQPLQIQSRVQAPRSRHRTLAMPRCQWASDSVDRRSSCSLCGSSTRMILPYAPSGPRASGQSGNGSPAAPGRRSRHCGSSDGGCPGWPHQPGPSAQAVHHAPQKCRWRPVWAKRRFSVRTPSVRVPSSARACARAPHGR